MFILEIACTFDSSMDEAFMNKVIKYQPLLNIISEIGYRGRLLVCHIWQFRKHTQAGCKTASITWDAQKEG